MATDSPLISIVTPIYNRGELLPRSIRSVLAQTYQNWELIIVDDGSTDSTHAIVSDFTDERIRYHWQENKQLNGARNAGAGLARGAWVCFLDDDDEFLPHHLEVLILAAREQRFQHDIYRSGLILDYGGEKTIHGHNYANDRDILTQLWEQGAGMFGMIIRREILHQHPFAEEHLLMDDFLWLNTVLQQHTIFQVDDHTALVHLHAEQRSANYLTEEQLTENVRLLVEAYYREGVQDRVPYSAYRGALRHQYWHGARQAGRRGEVALGLRNWWAGVSYGGLGRPMEMGKTLGVVVFGSL